MVYKGNLMKTQTTMTREHLQNRIFGCLLAAALGDAMGSATEQHHIDEIIEKHGGLLSELIPPPIDSFSYRGDNVAGRVTDDVSQMMALCEALITTSGNLDRRTWMERLLDWSINSPMRDSMGPTTRPILEAVARGESPDHIGVVGKSTRKLTSMGVTNGAAMRVAPAGLVNPGNIEQAVRTAWVTCHPTHETQIAAAGSAALAAGTAVALLPDCGVYDVVQACLEGARLGEQVGISEGRKVAGPNVIRRIEMAINEALRASSFENALRNIETAVGNSVEIVQSVPAAIGIFVAAKGSPLQCAIGGTNIGNDTDTIAAMACALAGALQGSASIPRAMQEKLLNANDEDFNAISSQLTAIAWDRYNDAASVT